MVKACIVDGRGGGVVVGIVVMVSNVFDFVDVCAVLFIEKLFMMEIINAFL